MTWSSTLAFLSELMWRRIEAADTEPYWLTSDQYHEHDGGFQLLPAMAGDMIISAQSFAPSGSSGRQ
jgi:hypothetical protein